MSRTYKCNEQGYSTIYLKHLIFDEKVADLVEAQRCKFPTELMDCLLDMPPVEMTHKQLSSIQKVYQVGLPAITVKENWTGTYNVTDGRHRIAAIILAGGDRAPCFLSI